MAKIMNVGILLLPLLLLIVVPHSTQAEEHAVGWIIPPQGASFYSTYVANITFRQNDILVFNFRTGAHNVVTLSKHNFESCNVNESIQAFNTGPARITLNRTGEFYFACAFPTHCSNGQKLSFNVTAASSSSSSSSSSPLELASVVTFSVLLIAIALNVLF